MPIIKGKPNPLDYFNCRKYHYPAEHLHFVDIEKLRYNMESAIDTWITHNLSGRYYLNKHVDIEAQQRTVLRIGFENPSEASYFQLACPLLKY